MNTHLRSGQTAAPSIFTSGEVDEAMRRGRRLRAEAFRNAFARLRPHLGPVD